MLNRPRRVRAYRPTTDALESLCLLSTLSPALSRAPALAATRPEGREAGTSARASGTPEIAADRAEARTAGPRLRLRRDIPASGRPRRPAIPVRAPGAAAVPTAVRVSAAAKAPTGSTSPPKGVRSYIVGNGADFPVTDPNRPQPQSGLVLGGGGALIDAAFRFISDRAAGGDFLVLSASGNGSDNSYIKALGNFDSVETLVQSAKTSAITSYVAAKIRGAEAIWFAGGDQANYVNYWKDTAVEDALNWVANTKRIPIGGTSAGLAILGEYSYSALDGGSVTSPAALADPFSSQVTITEGFLSLPGMEDTITDSHFFTRDRMGRLATFLARIDQREPASPTRAIGVEEMTALTVDASGIATVIARPRAENPSPFVYFLGESAASDNDVTPGRPLTYRGVPVHRAAAGDQFDLRSWLPMTAATGPEARDYVLTADAGVLSSSNGAIYG